MSWKTTTCISFQPFISDIVAASLNESFVSQNSSLCLHSCILFFVLGSYHFCYVYMSIFRNDYTHLLWPVMCTAGFCQAGGLQLVRRIHKNGG